jgi:DNA-binding CsgD family transcriptional regulator
VKPLVVVEASTRGLADAKRELERAGLTVVDGWQSRPGAVCAGVVEDALDAAEALLAAIGGAGVVIEARADRDVTDRLLDDLRRLGAVDHRIGDPEVPRLTAEERELLALLAGGSTLGSAASRLHLSRRTADRRLAAARRKLGAASTAEAVVEFARLGETG